jgi:hypothetical protein
MTQMGQVMRNDMPAVGIAKMNEIAIMMSAPGIVLYSIPNGPKRIVSKIAAPTLLGGRGITYAAGTTCT